MHACVKFKLPRFHSYLAIACHMVNYSWLTAVKKRWGHFETTQALMDA